MFVVLRRRRSLWRQRGTCTRTTRTASSCRPTRRTVAARCIGCSSWQELEVCNTNDEAKRDDVTQNGHPSPSIQCLATFYPPPSCTTPPTSLPTATGTGIQPPLCASPLFPSSRIRRISYALLFSGRRSNLGGKNAPPPRQMSNLLENSLLPRHVLRPHLRRTHQLCHLFTGLIECNLLGAPCRTSPRNPLTYLRHNYSHRALI